jgi:hypothetical protein
MVKRTVTCEAMDSNGRSLIIIESQPLTVYERQNGSAYVMLDRKRHTVTRRPDGSLYMRLP